MLGVGKAHVGDVIGLTILRVFFVKNSFFAVSLHPCLLPLSSMLVSTLLGRLGDGAGRFGFLSGHSTPPPQESSRVKASIDLIVLPGEVVNL